MKIIRDTQRNCARMAAEEYRKLLNENPHCVLGLATGSTPEMLYEELVALCKAGKLSFKDVTTYNLDEYVGLDGSHPQSYRYFMDSHLFNLVDIDKTRTHVPCGIGVTDEMAAHYDDEIKQAGGVDLQLLGIGHDGHIGFNEPHDAFDLGTHCVDLAQETIEANKRFFDGNVDLVPKQAYTMGIRTIMQARKVLMVVNGVGKAEIVKKAFFGPVTPEVPASILQLHPDFILVADEEALSLI